MAFGETMYPTATSTVETRPRMEARVQDDSSTDSVQGAALAIASAVSDPLSAPLVQM